MCKTNILNIHSDGFKNGDKVRVLLCLMKVYLLFKSAEFSKSDNSMKGMIPFIENGMCVHTEMSGKVFTKWVFPGR